MTSGPPTSNVWPMVSGLSRQPARYPRTLRIAIGWLRERSQRGENQRKDDHGFHGAAGKKIPTEHAACGGNHVVGSRAVGGRKLALAGQHGMHQVIGGATALNRAPQGHRVHDVPGREYAETEEVKIHKAKKS